MAETLEVLGSEEGRQFGGGVSVFRLWVPILRRSSSGYMCSWFMEMGSSSCY